ncbi:MBL fold metallo-hydrolase [Chloroflexota bacterium]
MTEILPGIYRIPLPLHGSSLSYINTYLIRGDNERLLIDTGWDSEETLSSLKRQLAETGTDLKDITQVIATHTHADHYSLAHRLKKTSGAKLIMHHLEADLIRSRFMQMDRFIQQLDEWSYRHGWLPDKADEIQTASWAIPKSLIRAEPDIELRGDETISIGSFRLKVLWSPGHSPGQICLYEPMQKVLFSGDHILPNITPHISLNSDAFPESNPLGDFLHSLDTLIKLEVNLVLPGHEQPFTGLQSRIEKLIHHHHERNSEILSTLKAEPKTGYQISTEITWMSDINPLGWHELSPQNKRMALLETLAHLEFMRFKGKLSKSPQDGILYYQLR